MNELYIGLMSGTSADGIDAVLADFTTKPRLISHLYVPYTPSIREKILALYHEGEHEIKRLAELDIELGKAFAEAANELMKQQPTAKEQVRAIGSHGQTIRHNPYPPHPYSLQIGDPNTITALTGITTIADFRRKDMALGGQGAPLVPAFHEYLFADAAINRAIVNIGGISNVTFLTKHKKVMGFDIGPGNALMDSWIQKCHHKTHDMNGSWALEGKVQERLLASFLDDPYFHLTPPKSSGREYFNLSWLNQHVTENDSPQDVQATLLHLTAHSIINDIKSYMSEGEILLCGGGAHNIALLNLIRQLASPMFNVATTEEHGISPDWVEAMAFAWLAQQTLKQKPSNIIAVTGAKRLTVLGGIYYG